MRIFRSIVDLPPPSASSVVTIGNFDGVHRGHQMVLARVRDRARELGGQAVAVTFDPHPAQVLRADHKTALLTPTPRKLELLAETGIDATLVLPFNDDLRRWTARQFAADVLRDGLRAAELHEGETFRFGYGAEAGIDGLTALGLELGFEVHTHQPLALRGEPVSSSRIRRLLAGGRFSEARALLGRAPTIDSTPASGRGYGGRYAVPTINLAPYAELLPANGVYATTLRIGEGPGAVTFRGVTNAGNRPTFGADSYAVETHLFDFSAQDLTESTPLRMTFLHRLRDERRFESPEALRAQIGLDVRKALRLFALCDARST